MTGGSSELGSQHRTKRYAATLARGDVIDGSEAIHVFNPFVLNPRTYVRTYMGFQTQDMPTHQPVHISWKSY